jgi:hypothetical protein
MREQRIRLRVSSSGGAITVRRLTREGRWGKKECWKVGKTSNLPRVLYFLIRNFVHAALNRCKPKGDYPSLRKATVQALRDAARVCGCRPRFDLEDIQVVWYWRDVPLVAFQIHYKTCKVRRVEKLLMSDAIFRWTIRVKDSGWFRIGVRATNRTAARPKNRSEWIKPV